MSPPWRVVCPLLCPFALPWLELLIRFTGRWPFLFPTFLFRLDPVCSSPVTSLRAPDTLWRKAWDMSFPLRASDASPTPVFRPALRTFCPALLTKGMTVRWIPLKIAPRPYPFCLRAPEYGVIVAIPWLVLKESTPSNVQSNWTPPWLKWNASPSGICYKHVSQAYWARTQWQPVNHHWFILDKVPVGSWRGDCLQQGNHLIPDVMAIRR